MFAQALDTQAALEFAADVRHYLSKTPQRELHSKYLYDDIGTALFEAITLLPEYGLTRADERVLRRYAPDIVRHVPSPAMVAELGSGSGRKTRWILEALARRDCTVYYPIDVSAAALHACRNELGTMDRGQAAALVGVAPFDRDSGRHKGKRVIRGGRRAVRSVLYMSAVCGIRFNPILSAFAQRLQKAGKLPKVIIVAAMRKLVCIINAMVRDGLRWDQLDIVKNFEAVKNLARTA